MLRSDKNSADFSSAAFFIPSIILFAAQQELHVREGPLLPDVPHHLKQLFQQRSRLGVEQIVVFAVLVILPGGGVGVPAAQIDLAGGHTVADHLADVPQGDLHAGEAGFRGAVVDPVFEVMLVAALVVEPCRGVAPGFPLRLIGAVVALIVDAARDELGGAVLAQIVGKSLLVEPSGKAVFHHQQLVPGDGLKMAFDVHAFRHLTVTFPSLRFRKSPLSEKSSRS